VEEVGSVCVYSADFNSHSLPVEVCDYYDTDKALAQNWNRNAKHAGCTRKL
jgi:hypothetical protein